MRQVAAANEELTHFAYIVSHDLKAPLRGIKLLTEWLCVDYGDKLGDDAKQQLDLLHQQHTGPPDPTAEPVGRAEQILRDVDGWPDTPYRHGTWGWTGHDPAPPPEHAPPQPV